VKPILSRSMSLNTACDPEIGTPSNSE